MYQLVSHVTDGLGRLKSLLEKHICTQGLSAIEKCGYSALNVSKVFIVVAFKLVVFILCSICFASVTASACF